MLGYFLIFFLLMFNTISNAETKDKILQNLKFEIPSWLDEFVDQLTNGNPWFIKETIDMMIKHGHIKVVADDQ